MEVWGVWPDEDRHKREVSIADVVEISSSPVRLPSHVAAKIYDAGESGMGYCVFALVLADGGKVLCCTGNAVDFVELPEGITLDDVVDVVPRAGRWEEAVAGSSSYAWCLYELPPLD